MHADGYVEIKDRSKDVIISDGENISSVEVESVLYTNPAVNEAAVVARPDEFWGEMPCAFVGLKEEYRRGGKKTAPSEFGDGDHRVLQGEDAAVHGAEDGGF
ncbi:putative acyl-activating enzyme 8 [Acorus calamus]|uniref:Acyl-activating enzyme 8 n=1 Tax=Acorus calamus TaxID=4465 RepID=A0AAV9D780_ACOCL|nr:putative acyl-activating enzyme 8 [Acorus calamus]